MIEPAAIPGMIEPGEQDILIEIAASDFVANNGVIVEFGTFLGRSTACLIKGASTWWSKSGGKPAVYAYDVFTTPEGVGMAPSVLSFAKRAGVGHLVKTEDGELDFFDVYQHFVGEAEQAGILRSVKGEARDAQPIQESIGLLHIDAPKDYEKMKPILFRFLPRVAVGGTVVFQDYLYHWAATQIASVQLLVERGILRMERSAATSLVTTVLRAPTGEDLLELDLDMEKLSIPDLIDRNIAALKSVKIDRPEQFITRVHLAKLQYYWVNGDHAAAQKALMQTINYNGGGFTRSAFADFSEMMSKGFDIG